MSLGRHGRPERRCRSAFYGFSGVASPPRQPRTSGRLQIHIVGCTSLPSQRVHAVGKAASRAVDVCPTCHQIGSSASRGTLLRCHLPSEKVGTPVFFRSFAVKPLYCYMPKYHEGRRVPMSNIVVFEISRYFVTSQCQHGRFSNFTFFKMCDFAVKRPYY